MDFGCIKEVHINITNGPKGVEVLICIPVYLSDFFHVCFHSM